MHCQRKSVCIFSSVKAVEELSKGKKRDSKYRDVKE